MTAAARTFAASFPAPSAASAMIRGIDCFGWAIRTNIFGRLMGVEITSPTTTGSAYRLSSLTAKHAGSAIEARHDQLYTCNTAVRP
jgi:hypothetical protein